MGQSIHRKLKEHVGHLTLEQNRWKNPRTKVASNCRTAEGSPINTALRSSENLSNSSSAQFTNFIRIENIIRIFNNEEIPHQSHQITNLPGILPSFYALVTTTLTGGSSCLQAKNGQTCTQVARREYEDCRALYGDCRALGEPVEQNCSCTFSTGILQVTGCKKHVKNT